MRIPKSMIELRFGTIVERAQATKDDMYKISDETHEQIASIKSRMQLMPDKEHALTLILEAAKPDGFKLDDREGHYAVSPEGNTYFRGKNLQLENVDLYHLLYWSQYAASTLAQRELDAASSRQLKTNILLQPIKDQAIALISQATGPAGLKLENEGGQYVINSKNVVSWTTSEGAELSKPIQEMPIDTILAWAPFAAQAIATHELALGVSSDPTGLGL